jgi:hypothetical protein
MYVPSAAGAARVLAPNGLVVGLRIPGAHEKFIALLEEDRIELGKGDVLVFYTDGITEAMNSESDLFGDARDHHAAIGMSDQADVAQIVRFDVCYDRGYRLLEANLLAIIILVVAGNRGAVHDVAALSQMPGNRFHFGAGVPRAVNQNISVCHSRLPSVSKIEP